MSDNSAQYCGCDKGASYLCERHRVEAMMKLNERPNVALTRPIPVRSNHSKNRATTLPTDAKERKKFPIGTGVLDYFPDAMVALANLSWQGNNQHNPGQPLHWAREKSTDQDDTMIRHFMERGSRDTDGQRHSAKMAWRALALLQLEIEGERGQ